MTLSRVNEADQHDLYRAYASDRQMRLNRGIRRRLAPMVGHDLRKLKLLYSFIFSLPGSPMLYYGDDIGMGDNVSLADRGGLRTPMQWSDEPNAGFSRADPTRLYAPVTDDPAVGYHRINVESQLRDQNSLLAWIKKIVALRKNVPAFAHGTFTMIPSPNPHVLTYLRQHGAERVVVSGNLSGREQRVEVDLRQFAPTEPIDLLGNASLPSTMANFLRLNIEPYGFRWLRLT
jgi:maltose alpha-D-glucosyltransferase/alpha-amylase